MQNLSADEFKKLISEPNVLLIDVRAWSAWNEFNLEGSENLPLEELELVDLFELIREQISLQELSSNPKIRVAFYCNRGIRSVKAIERLQQELQDYLKDEDLSYRLEFFNLCGGLQDYLALFKH